MGSKHFKRVRDFLLFKADPMIRCPKCRHVRRMDAAAFAGLFSWDMPLGVAVARLRCVQCGHKGGEVTAVPRLD